MFVVMVIWCYGSGGGHGSDCSSDSVGNGSGGSNRKKGWSWW